MLRPDGSDRRGLGLGPAATTVAPPPTPPGSSYCTWSPQPDCYRGGWPVCCLRANDGDGCPDERPPCDVVGGATAPDSEEAGEGAEGGTAVLLDEAEAVSREMPRQTVESEMESMDVSQESMDISPETRRGPMIPTRDNAEAAAAPPSRPGAAPASRGEGGSGAPLPYFILGGMVAVLVVLPLALAIVGRRRRRHREEEDDASAAATVDLSCWGGTFDEASVGDDLPSSSRTVGVLSDVPPTPVAGAKSIASRAGRWHRRWLLLRRTTTGDGKDATDATDATDAASNG